MIYTHYYNMYKTMKTKTKDLLLNRYHQEFLMNTNTEMFTHTFTTTEDINISRFFIDSIEWKLNRFGVVGFFIYEKMLLCEPVFFTGEPNLLGIPSDCYITIPHKGKKFEFKNWIVNEDVIIMKNNKLGTTDNDIDRVANVQTELDKSYICNIINSRLSPLVRTSTLKAKKEVDKVLENIEDGKPHTLSMINNIDDSEVIDILKITDVDDSSKIQNLSLAKEDVTKKFYQNNGVNLNSSIKQAQQSVAEITDGSNSAYIYPINKLKARTDCIEEFENKFNIKYNVVFSECWIQGYEMLTKKPEEVNGGVENGDEDIQNNGLDTKSNSDNDSEQSNKNNNINRPTQSNDN